MKFSFHPQVIAEFGRQTGRPVQHEVAGRRPGDVAACFASPARAEAELGFRAERSLAEMCESELNWRKKNPNGYGS